MTDDVVLKELLCVRNQHGKLEAKAVVDAARPLDSPLHNKFEWDDTVAAEHYREGQARRLIRTVRVVHQQTQQSYAAFVHVVVEGKQEGYYERTEIVARDVNLFARAYGELQRKIASLHASAAELQALAAGELPERSEMIAALIQGLRVVDDIAKRIPH